MNSMRAVYLFHIQVQVYAVTIAKMFNFSFMQHHGKNVFIQSPCQESLSLEAGLLYHLTAMVTMVTVVSCQIFL